MESPFWTVVEVNQLQRAPIEDSKARDPKEQLRVPVTLGVESDLDDMPIRMKENREVELLVWIDETDRSGTLPSGHARGTQSGADVRRATAPWEARPRHPSVDPGEVTRGLRRPAREWGTTLDQIIVHDLREPVVPAGPGKGDPLGSQLTSGGVLL